MQPKWNCKKKKWQTNERERGREKKKRRKNLNDSIVNILKSVCHLWNSVYVENGRDSRSACQVFLAFRGMRCLRFSDCSSYLFSSSLLNQGVRTWKFLLGIKVKNGSCEKPWPNRALCTSNGIFPFKKWVFGRFPLLPQKIALYDCQTIWVALNEIKFFISHLCNMFEMNFHFKWFIYRWEKEATWIMVINSNVSSIDLSITEWSEETSSFELFHLFVWVNTPTERVPV